MEKPRRSMVPVITFVVVLLGVAAFSCSLAAEFKKVKAKEIELDGNLCHLPRSPAFGLGVAAVTCLAVAQIAGTTVAATRLFARGKKSPRSRILPITLLVLSWISFALAAIMLATGSSMNHRQPYGRGWMNGQCYVVKDGVFTASAVLAAATVVFVIGFMHTTAREEMPRTSPDEERSQTTTGEQQQTKQADSSLQ